MDAQTAQHSLQARARAALIALNFFAETNRMEPLLAVYLIEVKGWDVVWVGYVSVVMNLVMVVAQTPAGDLMDKTRHKRAIVAAALAVAAATTAAIVFTGELYAILLIKAAEGLAASMFLPGLMSLLLAVVADADVPKTVAKTEVANKLGSVLFTAGTGLLSYFLYPDVAPVFYLLGGGGLVAAVLVLTIPAAAIDDARARAGQVGPTPNETDAASPLLGDQEAPGGAAEGVARDAPSKAWGYAEILGDRKIAMFALLTFIYHLSNAAVVPLVAQVIAHQDPRSGLVFTSAVLCIFYLVQAPTAYLVGRTYERYGFKTILMLGHLVLPVRCLICGLLAMYWPNQYALAATQIFDGMGAGIYDTIMPLVVRSLVKGSGRFGVTFGFIVTCWRVGHGLSLLAGEALLKAAGGRYEVPFFVLGAGGLLSCALLAFGVSVPLSLPEESNARKTQALPDGQESPVDRRGSSKGEGPTRERRASVQRRASSLSYASQDRANALMDSFGDSEHAGIAENE